MTQSTQAATFIAATPDRILDVVADVDRYIEWANGVVSVDVLDYVDDPTGRARPHHAHFDVSSGFVKGGYTVEYSWDDARAVRWTLVDSELVKALDGEYAIVAVDGGSEVTYSLSLIPSIPLIGALRRRAEKQVIDTALIDLKQRVEASAP